MKPPRDRAERVKTKGLTVPANPVAGWPAMVLPAELACGEAPESLAAAPAEGNVMWVLAVICRACGEIGPRRDACVFCGSTDVGRCQVPRQ